MPKIEKTFEHYADYCVLSQFHIICQTWEIRVYFGTESEKQGFYDEVDTLFEQHFIPKGRLAPDCNCGRLK